MSIAVFASGSGSNFEEIVHYSRKENWTIPISLLIVDREYAGAIERAKRLGVPYYKVSPKNFPSKEEYEQELLRLLQFHQIEWIVLAGYLRIVGDTLLQQFEGKMVNIHPSLLPAFPGLHAIKQAYEYGVKITGVTVHFVDAGLDSGPILMQQAVEISQSDTLETITAKIHQVEHHIYPECVWKVVSRKVSYIPRHKPISNENR